jgi:hypothetical protein
VFERRDRWSAVQRDERLHSSGGLRGEQHVHLAARGQLQVTDGPAAPSSKLQAAHQQASSPCHLGGLALTVGA